MKVNARKIDLDDGRQPATDDLLLARTRVTRMRDSMNNTRRKVHETRAREVGTGSRDDGIGASAYLVLVGLKFLPPP
jgi:hypothetical protein